MDDQRFVVVKRETPKVRDAASADSRRLGLTATRR